MAAMETCKVTIFYFFSCQISRPTKMSIGAVEYQRVSIHFFPLVKLQNQQLEILALEQNAEFLHCNDLSVLIKFSTQMVRQFTTTEFVQESTNVQHDKEMPLATTKKRMTNDIRSFSRCKASSYKVSAQLQMVSMISLQFVQSTPNQVLVTILNKTCGQSFRSQLAKNFPNSKLIKTMFKNSSRLCSQADRQQAT